MLDEPSNIYVRTIALADIGSRQLMLTMISEGALGQTYDVKLLPGTKPLGLTHLLNQLLTAAFDIQLPTFVPDIMIDTVYGSVVHVPATQQGTNPPSAKAHSYYALEVKSQVLLQAPFGPDIPVSIQDFDLLISSAAGAPSDIIVKATVVPGSLLPSLDALLAFTADGGSVIGIDLNAPVSSATLISKVLQLSLSDEVANLLPTFSPFGTAPMRFYQASQAADVTIDGVSSHFLSGFNIDNILVTLLDDREFLTTLRVDNGFVLSASLQALDLGIVRLENDPLLPPAAGANLGGPLINVTDQTVANLRTSSISLATRLVFFPGASEHAFALTATYDAGQQLFSGTLAINQSILGVDIETLGIAWSKSGGFHITDFPIPLAELEKAIDFGKEITQIFKANPDGCVLVPDIKFSDIIHTHFSLAVAPTSQNQQPGLSITGTYLLQVAGYDVATIHFDPVVLSIEIPTGFDDLGHVIVNAITSNAQKLVEALINDRVAFMKFLGLVSLEEATEEVFNSIKKNLICRYGEQVLKESISESATDALGAAASGLMGTLVAAAIVFSAATAALSFFSAIGKCLSGQQQSDNSQAQSRQDAARDTIQSYLRILDNLTASYNVSDGQIVLDIGWNWAAPEKLTTDTRVVITIGAETFYLPAQPAGARIVPTQVYAGQTLTLSVQGLFSYQHVDYSGNAPSTTFAIPTLSVVSPGVRYEPLTNSLPVTWLATPDIEIPGGPVAQVSAYTVELYNLATGEGVPGMLATLTPASPLTHTFNLAPTTSPLFWPDPATDYRLRISLTSTVPALIAAPWQSENIQVLGGIGHTRVGLTFKIGGGAHED